MDNALDFITITAIWGAITGTLALSFEIYKWYKNGPKLEITVSPNMQVFDPALRKLFSEQLVMVRVVNRGTLPAKITDLLGWVFDTRLKRLFGKPRDGFFVVDSKSSIPLPVVLEPGQDWSGYINQKKTLEMTSNGLLYLGVQHTLSKKPVLTYVDTNQFRPFVSDGSNGNDVLDD